MAMPDHRHHPIPADSSSINGLMPRTQSVSSSAKFMEQQQMEMSAAQAQGHRLSLGVGTDEGGPLLDDLHAMQEMGDQV